MLQGVPPMDGNNMPQIIRKPHPMTVNNLNDTDIFSQGSSVDTLRAHVSALEAELITLKSKDGQLLNACREGDAPLVHSLVQAGASLDARDAEFRTPLHVAAVLGHHAVVLALVEVGATVNVADRKGRSILEAACEAGHTGIVESLLNAGALEGARASGGRALLLSCSRGHVSIVQSLLAADVPASTESAGSTALHSAAFQNSVALVFLLVDSGAQANAVDQFGRTPLHWACHMGHIGVALALLSKGASSDVHEPDGTTPLIALQNCPVELTYEKRGGWDSTEVERLSDLMNALSSG
eukprot:gene17866-24257_t